VKRAFAIVFLFAAIGIAGCGGDNGTTAGTTSETTAQSTTSTTSAESAPDRPKKGAWGAIVRAQSEHLGIILFDLSGHTLYRFTGDKGTTSTCYGACAKRWPPALTEGKVRPMEVIKGLTGTSKRKDGTLQLTYAGHPLYTHSGEPQGGTKGSGVTDFGAKWFALRVTGKDATS
jgi:predicted lipoprotein with Yx(FWY)xxD motif